MAGVFDEMVPTVLECVDGALALRNYLIFDAHKSVTARRVAQRDGRVRYAVDQKENPHTVALQYGGRVESLRLVASQIGTTSEDPIS